MKGPSILWRVIRRSKEGLNLSEIRAQWHLGKKCLPTVPLGMLVKVPKTLVVRVKPANCFHPF